MSSCETPCDKIQEASAILNVKKVGLFVIAYNAEKHIQDTLSRIPKEIVNLFAGIYLIDDSSEDGTVDAAGKAAQLLDIKNFQALKTPFNQGYGGNQKIGYTYAINKGYDYVIMLHGDGQYAPELLPDIICEFKDPEATAVFGSRMMNKYNALRGGMPFYKWTGNQILTKIENRILGSNLSEFHTGYRAYSTAALKSIPYLMNSDNFHFDTDIIIQFVAKKLKIREIPISTHYGNEKCHVNGFKYAWNCLKSVMRFRLHMMGVFYQPSYDMELPSKRKYDLKNNRNTLHQYIRNLPWEETDIVADIGASDGRLSADIAPQIKEIVAADISKPDEHSGVLSMELDFNDDFDRILGYGKFNKVIALDIIEHLNEPESAVARINNIMKNDGILFASTANIAYIVMRMVLLIGWFHYGSRGILDNTHHRLFTVNSFKKLLKMNGFEIKKIVGFGPPIADQISGKGIFGMLDSVTAFLAKLYPSLFSFNFLVIARKKMNFDEIYELTVKK